MRKSKGEETMNKEMKSENGTALERYTLREREKREQ